MKLAFAVLALLCLSSVHATGIPKLEVTKSNEGIKSPEVTVKLPSITVGIPKVNVSGVMDAMPKMKLPKIDMPSVSVNMQTPSFDMSALQGLISAAMNKPSMNLTGLASMMQMPSVNMAGLASLLQKPSVDMSGLVALLTKSGNGSISIPGIPQITSSFNAADIVVNLIKAIKSALPTVDTATALKVVEAISAQMSKPGLDINIPMKSIPDFNISTPQIDLTPLASLFKAHPMPQINIDESQITALTNMLIQKPVNMTNHVLDGMVALANKASSMPQVRGSCLHGTKSPNHLLHKVPCIAQPWGHCLDVHPGTHHVPNAATTMYPGELQAYLLCTNAENVPSGAMTAAVPPPTAAAGPWQAAKMSQRCHACSNA